MLARTLKDHIMFLFDMISVNIRDVAGDLVAFEHVKVIITLHFRHSKTRHFM